MMIVLICYVSRNICTKEILDLLSVIKIAVWFIVDNGAAKKVSECGRTLKFAIFAKIRRIHYSFALFILPHMLLCSSG
jgi:hypothetical protein